VQAPQADTSAEQEAVTSEDMFPPSALQILRIR
jgi:hypothetical protein